MEYNFRLVLCAWDEDEKCKECTALAKKFDIYESENSWNELEIVSDSTGEEGGILYDLIVDKSYASFDTIEHILEIGIKNGLLTKKGENIKG